MRRSFIIIVLATVYSSGLSGSPQEENLRGSKDANVTNCTTERSQARLDAQGGSLKYYVFGFAAPSHKFVETAGKRYGITVVSMGCILQESLLCYNGVADSVIQARYGVKAMQAIRKGH